MKFTLSWLKDHLDTQATAAEIGDVLTNLGLELEGLENKAEELAPFTVAYVKEAAQHPNADRLKVCTVDPGDGSEVQVICGAPNAKTGMKGVFAPVGSYVPGIDTTLKAGKIRGVESNGMLVSEREMGISDEHEGIIELDPDAPLGKPFAKVMGLDDPVFDIAITPNRADCLGVRGVARDLAAAGMGTLKDDPRLAAVAGTDQPVPRAGQPDARGADRGDRAGILRHPDDGHGRQHGDGRLQPRRHRVLDRERPDRLSGQRGDHRRQPVGHVPQHDAGQRSGAALRR